MADKGCSLRIGNTRPETDFKMVAEKLAKGGFLSQRLAIRF